MSGGTNASTQMVAAQASPFAELETAFQQMLSGRSIFTAVGAQLDIIGRLVGADRGGLDDDTYRRYIRAQIKTNKSNGTINELITITDLIVFEDDADYIIDNVGRATVVMRVEQYAMTYALALILIDFLRRSVAAGVRIILEFWPTADEGELFTFAAFPGETQHGKGFATFADPTDGGVFIGAID